MLLHLIGDGGETLQVVGLLRASLVHHYFSLI
jgi:hypothetical protein